MTRTNRFSALAAQGLEQSEPPAEPMLPTPPAPPTNAPVVMERTRMLGGRVPDSVFREFGHAKLDAEAALRIRRVTTEEAIEAFVRMLRRPEVLAAWHEEVREVRAGRKE